MLFRSGSGNLNIDGTLTKGVGSFCIPNPIPNATGSLWHSFVESPTAGDNLYRWQINVKDNYHEIKLPQYYSYLNEAPMVWISPVDHFGQAYGKINTEQTKLAIYTNQDGQYNVLLIGTRKDPIAVNAWEGTERA